MTKRTVVPMIGLVLTLGIGLGACGGGGGASAASFCSLVKKDVTKYSNLGDSKADTQKSLSLFKDLENKAPSDIKSDLKVITDDVTKILKDPASAAALDQTDFTNATKNVESYTKSTCHVDLNQ